MDYQFFGAQNAQYMPTYQAAPMPLTPGHSASEGEFHSPPTDAMAYEFTGNGDHHMTFDGAFHHQQNAHQQTPAFNAAALPAHNAFAPQPPSQSQSVQNGPPTPPNHHNSIGVSTTFQHQQQPKQPTQLEPQQQVVSEYQPSLVAKAEPSPPDDQGRAGSGSGDDDLTPAQSRRKAQNRAAQRAFRERKEKHVKDLEAKLASIEAAQKQTSTENERLKRDLQKISTENEILRATTSVAGPANGGIGVPSTTGPMHYNPTDFYSDVLSGHANKTLSHRIVESENGERLLAAGATWDFIIKHELFKQGRVDIGHVSETLKTQAKCDGQGPVFEESAIIAAIEQSVASGSDELL